MIVPSSTTPDAAGNLRGAFYMVMVTLSFTLGDALIRIVTETLPLFQAIFLRGCLASAVLAVALGVTGQWPRALGRRNTALISLRSVAEACAMIPFFIALTNMPFASVSALLQTIPLSVTLAGAVFLREPVGWRRLSAILVGLFGVMLIVQPGGAGFNAYSLLVLVTVAFVTVRDLTVRRIPREVPVLFMAFAMAVCVAIAAGLLCLRQGWAPVDGRAALLLAACSVTIIAGYMFATLAMRHGEIAFVTPFRYMALVWAVLMGFFLFGEWPDALTLCGAGIVVATGVYTLYREQVVLRRRGC